GLHRVTSVRHDRHQALHPIGVLGECRYSSQRLRLGSERRVRRAVRLADLPSFSNLAGLDELFGNSRDVSHLLSPSAYPSLTRSWANRLREELDLATVLLITARPRICGLPRDRRDNREHFSLARAATA